jgi:hypothetical protein
VRNHKAVGARRRIALLAVLTAAALLGVAGQAYAATFTVGTTADTATNICPNPAAGTCSLRQLILFENNRPANSAADTILVPANPPNSPYQLNGTELLIQQNVNIVGAGARTTTIEQTAPAGIPRARVFDIQPNGSFVPTATISGLTIEFGFVTAASTHGAVGGNVLNAGRLTLSEDQIVLGEASGGTGAGISNDGGTLTVTHSLIDNNLAVAVSGIGGPGSGIENLGTSTAASHLTIDNSTIVSNQAINSGAIGGAVVSRCTSGTSACSVVTISNSTIADNDGGPGTPNTGGLFSTQGSISVENSIIAGNTVNSGASNSNCRASSPGTITSLGHNLEDHADCGFTSSGDLQNTNPGFLFSGTSDTGGNTDTFALSATSPAVDRVPTGAPGCSGTDQRDVARPQGSACDMGAYELTQQVEGLQFTQVLGSIDSNTDASIDWGDGTPQSSTHSDPANGQVTATHTYVEAGVYHGEINFVNSDGLPDQTPFDIKVVDAPLTSAASPVSAIAGVSFTGAVATLTDANPFGTASDFAATITWGDGTVTPGVVSPSPGGGFTVKGPHTYAQAGTYPTTIAINDDDGASTTAHGTAIVGARPTPVVTGPPDVKGSTTAAFAGSVNPDGAATTAQFEYGLDRRYVTPGASGPQYDHSTPSQSVGSDFSSHSVSASVSGLVPNALYHVRLVATNAAGTTNGPDMTFTTDRGPAPGAPGLGKTFNVSSTGLVLIKVHGVFIPLTELTKITNGTIINALHGTLSVTTALPAVQHAVIAAKKKAKKPKTKTQQGKFGGAVFKVTQARSGLATLALVEGAFKGAPSYASCKTKKGKAVTAALSKKTLQLLHGSAHGKFRSKGRYAAATVRGTIWTIADRCDGTLTHAIKDTVTVNDFVLHKTIILRPPHSYLAPAKAPHKRK